MKRYLCYILGIVLLIIVIYKATIMKPVITILPEIDYILIEKKQRLMSLYKNKELIKQYSIALGKSPIGHKEQEGDGKTPEGRYRIISKNAKSSYHLSLKISYPAEQDIMIAKSKGKNPGSDIMIHGIRNGLGWIGQDHRLIDWTRGCIAVSNHEIEEIYSAVQIGTIVEIKP